MRWKKLLLLVCLFLLLGAVTVWASDTYESYGRPVSVFINDQQVNTRGLLMQMGNDSKVMMPLRDVADMLQAMVTWNADTQTVRMYKPNVHIFLSTMNRRLIRHVWQSVSQRET